MISFNYYKNTNLLNVCLVLFTLHMLCSMSSVNLHKQSGETLYYYYIATSHYLYSL